MSPILYNGTEIIILGGRSSAGYECDGWILDISEMSLSIVLVARQFKFECQNNQSMYSAPFEVVGLVTDENKNMCMIKYVKGEAQVRVIEQLGKYE